MCLDQNDKILISLVFSNFLVHEIIISLLRKICKKVVDKRRAVSLHRFE